jgi:hypothetical protein
MDVLEQQGVDWNFIRSEIEALSLGNVRFLPTDGQSGCIVNIHGDSHLGNIMRDHDGKIRLIDFDMCTTGQVDCLPPHHAHPFNPHSLFTQAGTEFGFIVLQIFRCGFNKDSVMSLSHQQFFVEGYLQAIGMDAT